MTAIESNELDTLFTSLADDQEGASQYLSIFIDEAQTTIDELIEALLALETGGGHKQVEQLFISAHRMKGSAASIGLNRIAKLSHLMEDMLQMLVDTGRAPTPEITDAMLSCTDGLRQYVNGLGAGEPQHDRFSELAKELLAARATLGETGVAPAGTCDAGVSPAGEEGRRDACTTTGRRDACTTISGRDACTTTGISGELHRKAMAVARADEHEVVLVGRVVFEPDLPLVGLKARLVYEKLTNLGPVRYFDPTPEGIDTIESLDAIEFAVSTEKPPEIVRRAVWVAGISEAFVELLKRPESPAQTVAAETPTAVAPADVHPASKAEAIESAAKPAETMRVDIERLDELMNLAGQLAIGKAGVQQIAEKLKAALAEKDMIRARDGIADLFEAIHLLDRVSDGIQQGVMNMRMLPIGPLFSRFHRVIRDLTRANGKDIRLDISGENTELDKRMIDELSDPMIHIIRNAADHGIESPEARVAAGKSRQATIALAAFHRGSNIVIRVSDDGRGLNTDRIREKAVARGLVSAADAERLSPREIHQFIWLPGFSTADRVTEVSGRGVGMDIVRAKIEELNGTVDIDSEAGRGTTLSITLPLTLAILPSLLVEIGSDVFAVPMESVVEIVHVSPRDISMVQGRRMACVRDRIVSIVTLDSVFNWRRSNRGQSEKGQVDIGRVAEDCNAATLVIIGEGAHQLGLAVDQVLCEQDVVIKSISDNYRNVAGIAGASILGDGRVSLILDPHALIEMPSRRGINPANTSESSP